MINTIQPKGLYNLDPDSRKIRKELLLTIQKFGVITFENLMSNLSENFIGLNIGSHIINAHNDGQIHRFNIEYSNRSENPATDKIGLKEEICLSPWGKFLLLEEDKTYKENILMSKSVITGWKDRQQANRDILAILSKIVEEWPSARFSQILHTYKLVVNSESRAHSAGDIEWKDEFYLESEKLLLRVKEEINAREKLNDKS